MRNYIKNGHPLQQMSVSTFIFATVKSLIMKKSRSLLSTAFAAALLLFISCTKDEGESFIIDGVSLDVTQSELIPGESVKLTATLLPFNKVVDENTTWESDMKSSVFWRSDNPNVAQVDDKGVVTAKGTGSCNVGFICGSYAAYCKVTVRSFNKDILYGLWESDSISGLENYFFSFEDTGYNKDGFFDWTFDGMRLKLTYKVSRETRQLVVTSVASGKMVFYNTADTVRQSLSLNKRPMAFTPEELTMGQVDKPGLGDSLIKVVDMGLPSGKMWAVCNLGADTPDQDGVRYAWAEDTLKRNYLLDNYTWYDKISGDMIKYADDGLTEYEPDDDPVVKFLGEKWGTPSAADVTELIEYCYVLYSSLSGREGLMFIPKNEDYNDRRLFIPFSLSSENGTSGSQGSYVERSGYFWTSSLAADDNFAAKCFYVNYDKSLTKTYSVLSKSKRFSGLCIRPVFDVKK